MKRRLFRILSIASLALCVVAAAMWVRGRFGNDLLTWTTGAGDTLVALRSGERLDLTVARDWPGGPRPLAWRRLSRGAMGEGARWPTGNARVETWFGLRIWRAQGWFGERAFRYPPPPTYPITTISIGWDTLALLGAIFPSSRLGARLYRRPYTRPPCRRWSVRPLRLRPPRLPGSLPRVRLDRTVLATIRRTDAGRHLIPVPWLMTPVF